MWAASCLAACCASCACEACRSVAGGISRRSARIAYCGLFALSLIISWVLREVAAPLMEKLPSLLVASLVCYVATFSFSGLLFYWFTPSGHDWSLNTILIVMTLILVFMFALIALHPTCTYLCYSGMASEPRDYECNGLHRHSKAVSTGSLTLGLLTTVLSVVYSAVRACSSTALLSPTSSPRAGSSRPLLCHWIKKMNKKTGWLVDVSNASLASMYSAMLLTGWLTSVGESGNLVDVGWPSVWVRIVTGWATAALYMWSLVAPVLFPDREF